MNNYFKRYIFTLAIILAGNAATAQQKTMLIKNAYLHVGNGETLASAAIGIKNGKITLIKNSLAYSYSVSDWDTIIDVKGKHVYPGFIAPNTTLGITEIDAVRATRDFHEVGIYNPHVRSQIAYNVESEVIKTVRSNGVLLSQPVPRGGVISGTSSIMAMDGWNWEDATVLANDGVHVNWPSSTDRMKDNRAVQEKSKDYQSKKQELYSFFEASMVYTGSKNTETDLRYEAMKGCFKDKKRVYFHADDLQQINDIIDFVQYFKLSAPVIVGGYDAGLVARKLKDAKIPVMLYRTHSLPKREEDPIHQPYSTATRLQEEGVLFCLQNEGDMEAMNARNLPFLAGTAHAYGLTEEQAVMAITLNTCKIIGIEKEYGSIEVGKSATLFISEGNALDMRTNNVVFALINGKQVDLGNKQKDLYNKYKQKYEEQK
jgi:imidazolonepropionase-like amidohydrolase